MHIPTISTDKIDILSFEAALKDDGTTEYDRDMWQYVPNFYSEYRYILGTKGKNPLICIGINPSTAAPDNLDNTLKSVSRIASGNGFDSFIMFNVYAQRATRPDDMDKECNEKLHLENMKAFEYILKQSENPPTIWAAWGAIIEKRKFLRNCINHMTEIASNYDAKWVKVGKVSIKGHPHHPLYLKKDSKTEEFDLTNYLNTL